VIPRLWISELAFSDESVIHLAPCDAVLIVGPNNAGKSACLRAIRNKLTNPAQSSPVIKSLRVGKAGTTDDVISWLSTIARLDHHAPGNPSFQPPFRTSRLHYLRISGGLPAGAAVRAVA
jgi:hypothetical protein